jgi:topoisomerase-4 subunit A
VSNVQKVEFKNVLEDKYFSYALSTIMSRSLPDLRDGLKPVHRRLLHAMRELKLDPKNGYKKCARIVGDVIGKFHPHGDTSVYDALVRMAQSFSMRYPIVEGQGNFGSIDGDSQAAMRYTEAKLTPYAMLLLKDIEHDTVDFRDNYDSSDTEPVVMPSAVPNILANGSEGIAVGMATSIPPHNIIELMDVLLHLIAKPNSTLQDVLPMFNGPDFPTGGSLLKDDIAFAKVYETGRGSFKLRANWFVEELERGKYQIVINEIPYQVNKRRIIEQLAELYQEKKIPFVENFQDQSAEDVRVVINPKSKNMDAAAIMESLFSQTDLEVRVNANLNVLNSKSHPNVMGLIEILSHFLDHRRVVLKRKLENRLSHINHRLEILGGLLIAFLNLDEVIRIIREEDDPKAVMMARWNLTDNQAEAILNTRLRSLRRLEETAIEAENKELTEEKNTIESTLASDKMFEKYLKKDIESTKTLLAKEQNSKRKTQIIEHQLVDTSSLVIAKEKYPLTVTCSKLGWLKAFKDHGLSKLKYRDGDDERFVIETTSVDKIIIFSSYGKFYNIDASSVQQGRGDGEPIKLLFDFKDDEHIISCFALDVNVKYLIASKNGKGFTLLAEDMLSHTKAGKQVLNTDGTEAIFCSPINGEYILSFGENRRLLAFKTSEVPEMKRGKGVTLQKFKHGGIAKMLICKTEEELLKVLPKGSQRLEMWSAHRATYGKLVFGKIALDS